MIKKYQDNLKITFSCKEKLNFKSLETTPSKSCPDLKELEKNSKNDQNQKKFIKIMSG